jgi:hypothetical protein
VRGLGYFECPLNLFFGRLAEGDQMCALANFFAIAKSWLEYVAFKV